MKKMNFTIPNFARNWLVLLAVLLATFNFNQANAQSSCVLSVGDYVPISLNSECKAELKAKMFLTDTTSCPDMKLDSTEFRLLTQSGTEIYERQKELEVSIDDIKLGEVYMLVLWAMNEDGDSVLNSAMLNVSFIDKLAPTIECPDTVVIPCYAEKLYTPVVTTSSCGGGKDEKIILSEVVETVECDIVPNPKKEDLDSVIYKIIKKKFIAKDAAGNYSKPCEVVINVRRLDSLEWADSVKISLDTVVSCDVVDKIKDEDGHFNPDFTGWPYLVYEYDGKKDTIVLDNSCDNICGLVATYQDLNVNTCSDCLEKVIRTWTVMDVACPEDMRMKGGPQNIKVKDTEAPEITWCPDDTIATTTNLIADFSEYNGVSCGARYTFPIPKATDNCSEVLYWSVFVATEKEDGTAGIPIAFIDSIEIKQSTPEPADITKDLPYGTDSVTYIIADKCGNKDTCGWILEVEDHTPPVAICQEFTTVSLTYDGVAIVAAKKFDSGSYDDCALVDYKVRRMDSITDCANSQGKSDEFYDEVYFCCGDVDTGYVTVIMRVWDAGGNYNDCMVKVEVQDKLPPDIKCPRDICVPCDYPFDIDNMDKSFGKVVDGDENRETVTISVKAPDQVGYYFYEWRKEKDAATGKEKLVWWEECRYSDDTPETISFLDGYAIDNCDVDVTDSYNDKRDQCGNGNIIRTFTVNGTTECKQYIHFNNFDKFDEDDITWPEQVTIFGCYDPATIDPELTGYPKLNEGNCDLVGASYEDQVYGFNDDDFDAENICLKIIRRWRVMDWCQEDPEEPGTYMTWGPKDQVIMIVDTIGPVFDTPCVEKSTCTYDAACEEGYIELSMSAHDENNCTKAEDLRWRYRIDLDNDGSFDIDTENFTKGKSVIKGATVSASDTFPIGKHRIVWDVWDQCGNKTTCDTYFTIKNCKKPTPICIDHVVVEMMPSDNGTDGIADWAMIEVGPQLVEHCCAGSSHPCRYDLTYSFSEDPKDTSRVYYCGVDTIHENWYPVDPRVGYLEEVRMYVTAHLPDGTTTTDYCVTNIDFQDNNDACNPSIPDGLVQLSGLITNINDEPIPNVSVELQGSELAPMNTGVSGSYEFDIDVDRSYIVSPKKEDLDLAGVTTLDIVLIQKHILGLSKIKNPYTLLAANVSGDNRITAADILILRKLILGKINDMGDAWMFVDKDYKFEDPKSPYNEDIRKATPVRTNEDVVVNFYGIKMGDINLSVDMLEARSSEKLQLSVDAVQFESGVVEVPVYGENINGVEGFQYTFSFDNNVLSFEGVESGKLNISEANLGTTRAANGLVAMSWNSSNVKAISNDEVLFTLKFNAVSGGMLQDVLRLTSDIAKKEAYNSELEVMDVELEYRGENSGYALYQNTPNPFSEYTEISFALPQKSECTISIYDLTGKVVKVISNEFEQGRNSVRVNKNDLKVSGVLYYVLETEEFTATKKMIVLK